MFDLLLTASEKEAIRRTLHSNWRVKLFCLAAIVGVALRIFLSTLGHNYDIESWQVVGDIMMKGQSVFHSTDRHNYGPLLFYVFKATVIIQRSLPFIHHPELFHIIFVSFLSLVDLAIAWMLLRKVNVIVAVFFILNPVLILITGYHSQVDHVAIAVAFASWLLIDRERVGIFRLLISASLLGISLMIKHDFIFFPIWLLFYKPFGNLGRRLIYAFLVWSLFFGSFLPWVGDPVARARILKNVFLYDSAPFNGDSLFAQGLSFVFPVEVIKKFFSYFSFIPFDYQKLAFIFGVLISGCFVMKRSPKESFYFYLVSLIVFTSAVTDQYLAIPAMACAYFWRSKCIWIYITITTFFLLGSTDNLNILPFFRHASPVPRGGPWQYYNCQIWITIFFFLALARMSPQSSSPKNYSKIQVSA